MLMIVRDIPNDVIINYNISKEEAETVKKFIDIVGIANALYDDDIDIDFIPDEDIKKF